VITAERPIATLAELRDHLQYAIGIELTTIPAYLCGLYTIEPGANTAASEVIQSVVMEEMLHMALAANVLNGIGGVPATGPVGDGISPVPVYPAKVPFIDRIPEIHLQAFSPAAIDEFIEIERPADPSAPASKGVQYASIGAFYAAIEDGLRALGTPEVFEAAERARGGCQLASHHYYGGAGTLIEVTDLKSALAAVAEIVSEGEGVPEAIFRQTAHEHLLSGARTPGRLGAPYEVEDVDRQPFGWKMYSHYARFREVRAGRYYRPDQLVSERPAGDILPTDWRAVRPMTTNPKAEAYQGTGAYVPMVACNETYTRLVDTTYLSFNGHQEKLGDAVHLMYELKYRASSLLNIPSPLDQAKTLGPAFEYLAGRQEG
jgi:hypothetical protein